MANETENVMHQAQVSSYSTKTNTARVAVDDWESMVSGDLQVLVPGTTKMKVKVPLQAGDHVVALFQPNGLQQGYILGSVYTSSNLPAGTVDEYFIDFPDSPIRLYVNAKTHDIKIIAPNSAVTVECKTAKITASDTINANGGSSITCTSPTINLNGVVNVSSPSGSGATNMQITGTVNLTGTIYVNGDVVVNGVSFKGHTHTGVHGETSTPH